MMTPTGGQTLAGRGRGLGQPTPPTLLDLLGGGMDDQGVGADLMGIPGGGPTIGPLPPVSGGDSTALAGLSGGIDPWRNGGPTQMPPSQQGLATLAGSGGGGPATSLMTLGTRSMAPQSRAMTRVASRRPGRAVY